MNRFAIMRRDGFTCKYCGAKAGDGAKLHVDHIQPRSKGGTDHHLNLVTACARCNISKGATEPEWEPCSPTLDVNGYPWQAYECDDSGYAEDSDELFCSNESLVELLAAIMRENRVPRDRLSARTFGAAACICKES